MVDFPREHRKTLIFDETALLNGEIYTILANKKQRKKKGQLQQWLKEQKQLQL